MQYSSVSTLSRLHAIESLRRPVYKIFASYLEGWLGHLLYRRPPPHKDGKHLLHLGCGNHHFPGWVNADYYRFSDLLRKSRGLPDWMLDAGRPWRCASNYWDGIHTEHTLEHLNYGAVIAALKEIHRTLKPGKWLRIVLPGVNEAKHDNACRYNAEALAHLTQTHGHVSVWDAELMCAVLDEIGFVSVKQTTYGQGQDLELVKDLAERAAGSFYVEARK